MHPCPYCAEPMANKRRKQCGKPECDRAHKAAYMRDFFAKHKAETGKPYTARYAEKRRAQDKVRADSLPHWRHRYPELALAVDQRRARRVAGSLAGQSENFDPGVIFERDRWKCGVCHQAIDPAIPYPDPMSKSLDHIVPLSEGGPHTKANVRASHLGCNVSRGARGGNEQLMLIG